MQVLVAQKNRDDRTIRLSGTMSDVLASVEEAEPLKRIKAHMKVITLLVQQVMEITDYENKLREFKTAFSEGVAVQTDTTVARMMNVVEHLGLSDLLKLWSHIHVPGIQRKSST